MKLFPTKTFRVELNSKYSISMQALQIKTDMSDELFPCLPKTEFRGQVNVKGFNFIDNQNLFLIR
jgi:hypothetical protein